MNILHTYIPFYKKYKNTKGLSERQIRKRLEKDGWMVWRGGSINLIGKTDLYPNVEKKYGILKALLAVHNPNTIDELAYLCAIHHGLPDFICYRNKFKFVDHTIKMRKCLINILTGQKIIKEHQLRLKLRWKKSKRLEKKKL